MGRLYARARLGVTFRTANLICWFTILNGETRCVAEGASREAPTSPRAEHTRIGPTSGKPEN